MKLRERERIGLRPNFLTIIFPFQIYLAKGEVPAEGYKFFIEELLSTIREDIADCVENAYDRIRPEDIGKMLYLSSTKEILKYCETRGWQVGGYCLQYVLLDFFCSHGSVFINKLFVVDKMFTKLLHQLIMV